LVIHIQSAFEMIQHSLRPTPRSLAGTVILRRSWLGDHRYA
jgi:hypothetical protein